jgi:hypothetical protein
MAAGTLNTLVTKNPDALSGGDFGVIVGNKPNSTVGFYGKEGTTQPAAPADLAGLIAALTALGLFAPAQS